MTGVNGTFASPANASYFATIGKPVPFLWIFVVVVVVVVVDKVSARCHQ